MIMSAGYIVENQDSFNQQLDESKSYLYEIDSSFEKEWNNFDKICESMVCLQESGIITEGFKDTKFYAKFKEIIGKIKAWWEKVKKAIKTFWQEKIIKIFSKKARQAAIEADKEYIKWERFARQEEVNKEAQARMKERMEKEKLHNAKQEDLDAVFGTIEKMNLVFYDLKTIAPQLHSDFDKLWKSYKFNTSVIRSNVGDTGRVTPVDEKSLEENQKLMKDLSDFIEDMKKSKSISGKAGGAIANAMFKDGGKEAGALIKRTIDMSKKFRRDELVPLKIAKEVFAATDEEKVRALMDKSFNNLDSIVKTWEKMFDYAVKNQKANPETGKVEGISADAVKYFALDTQYLKKALSACEALNDSLAHMIAYNLGKLAAIETKFNVSLKGRASVMGGENQ